MHPFRLNADAIIRQLQCQNHIRALKEKYATCEGKIQKANQNLSLHLFGWKTIGLAPPALAER